MQHVTEDLSPVKKKITVTFPAEETDAAFSSAVSELRKHVRVNGFRPGKVPAAIIEKRFYDEVCRKASSTLIDDRIGEIIEDNGFFPLSSIICDGGRPEHGKEFSYSLTLDVLPEFEIPDYTGAAVELEEAVVTDDDLDEILDALRDKAATIIPVDGDRAPEDGELAFADWAFFDEQGAAMPDYAMTGINIVLGPAQHLHEVEALLKSMRPGEEKEGPVTFPPDYVNNELAGRTLGVRIKLHGIRKKILPDLDDDFAQRVGDFHTVEQMRGSLRETALRARESRNRSIAQKKLVENLLLPMDFPIPEGMVADIAGTFTEEVRERTQSMNANADAEGKIPEDLLSEVRHHAEQWVRAHVFLLNAARKKGFSVSDRDLTEYMRRLAERSGEDYASVKDVYERNNLLPRLRNELLAGKAMKEIYAAAAVTVRPPARAATEETDGASVPEPAEADIVSPDDGASVPEQAEADVASPQPTATTDVAPAPPDAEESRRVP